MRLIYPLFYIAPCLAVAAPIEISCVSPVEDSVKWLARQVEQTESDCRAKNDEKCPTLAITRQKLEECKMPDAKWGQKYVFHLQLTPNQAPTPSLVDVYFAACNPAGAPMRRDKPAKLTGSLSELIMDMSDEALSTKMVFRIDRETLEGGFGGKRNFQCSATESKRNPKI